MMPSVSCSPITFAFALEEEEGEAPLAVDARMLATSSTAMGLVLLRFCGEATSRAPLSPQDGARGGARGGRLPPKLGGAVDANGRLPGEAAAAASSEVRRGVREECEPARG